MSEPNMKLSRALLIVLVLHVVAVAGIIAFNTIKSRQGAFPPSKVHSHSRRDPVRARCAVESGDGGRFDRRIKPRAPLAAKPMAKEEAKDPESVAGRESRRGISTSSRKATTR